MTQNNLVTRFIKSIFKKTESEKKLFCFKLKNGQTIMGLAYNKGKVFLENPVTYYLIQSDTTTESYIKMEDWLLVNNMGNIDIDSKDILCRLGEADQFGYYCYNKYLDYREVQKTQLKTKMKLLI